MEKKQTIQVVCPSCDAIVEAGVEERILSGPTQCPGCGRVVRFQRYVSDEEAFIRGSAVAGKVAGKTANKLGHFAGRLIKKAASAGAEKYRDSRQRKERRRELLSGLESHLRSEHLSLEFANELSAAVQECGLDLSPLPGELKSLALKRLAREADRIRSSIELVDAKGRIIDAYIDALSLPVESTESIRKNVRVARAIHAVRTGRIKPLSETKGLVVRNSEVVWHQCNAVSVARSRAGEISRNEGILHVTNMRLVFTSRTSPDEIQLQDINAVEIDGPSIHLTGKSQTRSCEFETRWPDVAAEYIRYVLGLFHRNTDVGFQANSRRIPQDVKTAVWQRDGGQCVECGADDYLEFDHIIPFSKGGANTVENIQLLCRRCNSQKSDSI